MRERRAQPAANDDGIELTQTLRSLRVPVVANDPEVDESALTDVTAFDDEDWPPRRGSEGADQ